MDNIYNNRFNQHNHPISSKTPMKPELSFLICGLEHSGTTMASDLFREHPEIESGFECGVLLCEKPNDFQNFTPFRNHMAVGWGINEEDLIYACNAESFENFYQRLFERSSIVQNNQPKIIFDKTPRYVTQLKTVQSRLDLPAIVIIKDPRSLALSDFKRSGKKVEEIDSWYESWKNPKLLYMRSAYQGYQYAWESNRCNIIRLEDVCFNAKQTVKSMFEFVGLEFKCQYLDLRNKRFGNTSGSSISVNSCMQFMAALPDHIQTRIKEDFSEFDRWFYDF